MIPVFLTCDDNVLPRNIANRFGITLTHIVASEVSATGCEVSPNDVQVSVREVRHGYDVNVPNIGILILIPHEKARGYAPHLSEKIAERVRTALAATSAWKRQDEGRAWEVTVLHTPGHTTYL